MVHWCPFHQCFLSNRSWFLKGTIVTATHRGIMAAINENPSLLYLCQEVFCKYQVNDNFEKRNMETVLNVEFSNPYRNVNQRRLDHP